MSSLEPSQVEQRRSARERALELLYEAEIKGLAVESVLERLPLPPAPLAGELVRGVEAHRDRIDEIVARLVAPRWSLARLAAVDRAILRLGAYELMYAQDRTQAVIINEAVVLARRFGSDDSPRFVNGVLSAVAAEVRPAGTVDGASDAPGASDASGAGNPPRPVDALIIDLDGVIRHWDQEALPAAERELGLDHGTIAAAAFDTDRLARAMRGDMSFADWAAEIGAVVGEGHAVDPDEVAAAFTDVGWRIDDAIMELVDQVREQVPVALLSNASSRLLHDLERSGIAHRFDHVVASADIGVVKPQPEAFLAAAERLGVAAGRCLYVDDTEANVVAAASLGMRALHFRGIDGLTDELLATGLLGAAPS
jgi:putative hydrolase of the HAD superfamily